MSLLLRACWSENLACWCDYRAPLSLLNTLSCVASSCSKFSNLAQQPSAAAAAGPAAVGAAASAAGAAAAAAATAPVAATAAAAVAPVVAGSAATCTYTALQLPAAQSASNAAATTPGSATIADPAATAAPATIVRRAESVHHNARRDGASRAGPREQAERGSLQHASETVDVIETSPADADAAGLHLSARTSRPPVSSSAQCSEAAQRNHHTSQLVLQMCCQRTYIFHEDVQAPVKLLQHRI